MHQLKKWWVIIVLSLLCFFFTGGTVYVRQYAYQYEAELSALKATCYLDGWKNSQNTQLTPPPSATPEIIEIDTRNQNDIDRLGAYFDEYCKNNPCSTQLPSPLPTTKTTPATTKTQRAISDDEKTYCLVEKNGSFEMTVKECMEMHDKNPFEFQVTAYKNCVDGKNRTIGDSGTPESRKQSCSDLIGIVEN